MVFEGPVALALARSESNDMCFRDKARQENRMQPDKRQKSSCCCCYEQANKSLSQRGKARARPIAVSPRRFGAGENQRELCQLSRRAKPRQGSGD